MSQPLKVAGFEVIISGRFWVITKVTEQAVLTAPEVKNASGDSVRTGTQV